MPVYVLRGKFVFSIPQYPGLLICSSIMCVELAELGIHVACHSVPKLLTAETSVAISRRRKGKQRSLKAEGSFSF